MELWVAEVKKLFKLAAPTSGAYLSTMCLGIVSIFFVGRLGAEELAAAALGQMFCNVSGYSFGIGMLSAMDTFCSQAYGAGNYMKMGVILQRGILLICVFCIPVALIWLMSSHILYLVLRDHSITMKAGLYVRYQLPALFPYLAYEAMKKYLETQMIVYPQMFVAFAVLALHVIITYIYTDLFGWGLKGATLAIATSYWLLWLSLLAFVYLRKLHVKTWPGIQLGSAMQEWLPFLKLGLPGAAMLCLEWWGFELHALVAGHFGTVALASQSLILNSLAFCFMLPLGIQVAVATRVGNALGANLPDQAKRSIVAALTMSVAVMLMLSCFIFLGRNYLGEMFAPHEQEVIEKVASVLKIVCAFMVFDGLQGSASGVLKGSGRQMIGAFGNFLGYYVIAFPVGLSLAFYGHLDITGLWLGLSLGSFSVCVLFLSLIFKENWVVLAENVHQKEMYEGTGLTFDTEDIEIPVMCDGSFNKTKNAAFEVEEHSTLETRTDPILSSAHNLVDNDSNTSDASDTAIGKEICEVPDEADAVDDQRSLLHSASSIKKH